MGINRRFKAIDAMREEKARRRMRNPNTRQIVLCPLDDEMEESRTSDQRLQVSVDISGSGRSELWSYV